MGRNTSLDSTGSAGCRPRHESARDHVPRRRPVQPERVIKRPRMYVARRAVPVPVPRPQIHGVACCERTGTREVRRKLADGPADAVHLAASRKREHLVGCGIGGIRDRNRRIYNPGPCSRCRVPAHPIVCRAAYVLPGLVRLTAYKYPYPSPRKILPEFSSTTGAVNTLLVWVETVTGQSVDR